MSWHPAASSLRSARTRFLNISAAVVVAINGLGAAMPLFLSQKAGATPLTNAYVSTTGSGSACTHAAPCNTFAAALAVSAAGGVIHVANGTYNESFTVSNNVTIRSDHGSSNATINGDVTVAHDGVTLRGFTITNPSGTDGVLINNVNDVTVEYNAFNAIGTAYPGTSAVQALYVLKTSSNIDINHNTFTNVGTATNTASNKAIYVGDSNNGPSANVTIAHNSVDGVVANQTAWPAGHGAYGVLVNHQVTSLSVTNNVIQNLHGFWAHAVGLEADTPGAIVAHNTIKDVTGGIDSVAYRFETNPGALTTTMTSDTFNGHHASNSTETVAVDSSWAALDAYTASNTYPEVYFHGNFYYYGINAFSTIEDGMAHVSSGGTVFVESGTYSNVQATGSYASDITVRGYSHPTINGLDLTGATFNGLGFDGFTFVGDSAGYGNFSVTIAADGSYANLAFVKDIFDGQSVAGRGAIFLNRGFDGFTLVENTFKNYDGSAYWAVYSVVFAEAQNGTSGNNYYAERNRLTHSTADNFLEAYRWKNVTYLTNTVNALGGRLLVWSDDSLALGTVTVKNNNVKVQKGTGIGVYYAPATTAALTGNYVHGAESCVKLDGVSDTNVSGNVFSGCSVNGLKFSQSGATAPQTASIVGNAFENGPVGVENNVTSFVLDACDNQFTNITTPLFSNPGPFNTIKCEAAPTLIAPLNNSVVNGASLTNSWSSVSGATKYEYESFNSSDTTKTPRYDHVYNTTSKTATNVADGTVFWWRVRAIDQYGDKGPWSTLWKVTIDNTAPVVAITAPSDGDTVHGTVTISGTVSDAHPDHYYLVVKDSHGHIVAGPHTVYAATVADYDWDTTSVADGTYTIDLEARDAAGNKDSNSTRTISVTVDNTAPVVTVDTESTTDTTPTVTGTVDDNTASVIVEVNGNTYTATVDGTANGSGTYNWSADVTGSLTVGIYDVVATATDPAGNTGADSTTNELTITATSTAAPTVTHLSTTNNKNNTGGTHVLGASTNTPSDSSNTNTSNNSNKNGKVLGSSTSKDDNKSTNSKNTSDKTCSKFLGLCWYWWIPIVAVVIAIIYYIYRRADSEDKTTSGTK